MLNEGDITQEVFAGKVEDVVAREKGERQMEKAL